MNASAWERAKSLLAGAADLPPADRERFVVDHCPDLELRREVLELLVSPAPLSDILNARALQPGARLGPYVIEQLVGVGGMGEVYRASDTRLDRAVAIKVLPVQLAEDPQFRERFDREARTISQLDHPHICALYDVGEQDGISYLVMQYLEGETLADRLTRGALPLEQVLQCGMQIADALEKAHSQGIIHRDVKPANVFLTDRGHAKVLDFGLARQGGPTDAGARTEGLLTEPGSAVGTVAYMSPEQARGEPVDARSDLWSVGVVLYEMVTGSRPFDGPTSPMIFDAILNKAPQPVRERNPMVPAPLGRIIGGLLEKDRARRYASAASLRDNLERLQSGLSPAAAPGRRHPRLRYGIAATAVLIVAAGGLVLWQQRPHAKPLTDKDVLVLADFANTTGDPIFDDTLRQGLSVDLQQSPFLSLISDRQVQQQLALMGQPKEARLTSDVAQQVCERTASAVVLEGSIASLGSQYVLGLRAKNCNTGNILDQEQIQAARREGVLNALSEIARKLRTRLGESRATVEKHSTPLADATTPSLEALKAYSTGTKVELSSGFAAAIPSFQRAVEIDPKFAMAYASLGLAYSGGSVLSGQNAAKAWQLRDRVSDRERFFVDFTYDRQVTGNLEKAYQTLELWLQTYPRGEEPNAQSLLGGLSAQGTAKFDRAIETSQKQIAEDPDFLFGYDNLASGYFFLGRFEEAERVLRRATERKLEDLPLLMIQYNIAVLKGDKGQMDRIVALTNGKHAAEHPVANVEALALARSGRLTMARQSSSRAIALARPEGGREAAASYHAARAVWEAVCGNAAEAKKNAMAALELSNGRDVEYAAGLALAFSGDSFRSQPLADDLEQRFPEDTFAKFTYVPVPRSLAALVRGRPTESVERLRIAMTYELAVNGLNFVHFYLGGLHSAYVRGEAFVAAHRYPEAVVEFQKLLDHRGIVGADPIGTLAHLQLGRTFALSGDTSRAKAAYQDFLTLWKDADADIPIFQQAKAEYARLQ